MTWLCGPLIEDSSIDGMALDAKGAWEGRQDARKPIVMSNGLVLLAGNQVNDNPMAAMQSVCILRFDNIFE